MGLGLFGCWLSEWPPLTANDLGLERKIWRFFEKFIERLILLLKLGVLLALGIGS